MAHRRFSEDLSGRPGCYGSTVRAVAHTSGSLKDTVCGEFDTRELSAEHSANLPGGRCHHFLTHLA